MPKSMSMRELATMCSGKFAYILLYAPDFPEEDGTSLEKEMAQLVSGLTALHERISGDDRKSLMAVARTEVEKS
jgi:hypothetical protein